ncbi:scaffolding protein [Sporosarcina phage Lietuvens]|nr:scaffolding protein [Sporosarcina phage Lietuvens]
MTNLNTLLPLDLQFFSEPDDNPTPEPSPTPEKTFTQAELSDAIEKRLARDRAKYADYDELKTKAAEFEAERKRIEDEKLSESERLQKELAEAQAAKSQFEEQLTAMQKKAEADRIRAEFKRKAADAGVKYTDAAVKLSDMSALKFSDSGELEGVDSIINALITENPFLVVEETPKPKIIGEGSDAGGETLEKTAEQRLEEARAKAVSSGLPKDRAAYSILKRELGK